jgi:inorganic pyrophosphatase
MAGDKKKHQSEKAKPADDGAYDLDIIIETPKGCRNKYAYDHKHKAFKLKTVLPAGAVFPFDFGYVPDTKGQDGDPLDILVLMDEPAFSGCLVPARLIGVIEAEQTERDGETMRNDRLIAVAEESYHHREVRTLSAVSPQLLDEIEHFFVSYNEIRGKRFMPQRRSGPERAMELVHDGRRGKRHGSKK